MSSEEYVRERRREPRYGCAGAAEIVVPGCGLRFKGRIANLSFSGCLVEAACRLERGTRVELCFVAQGIPLRIPAHLMEQRANGVSFRMGQLSARTLEQIAALIVELEKESQKENPAPLSRSGIEAPCAPRPGEPPR